MENRHLYLMKHIREFRGVRFHRRSCSTLTRLSEREKREVSNSAPSLGGLFPVSHLRVPFFLSSCLLQRVSPACRKSRHVGARGDAGCSRRCHWQPIKLRKTLLIPFWWNSPRIPADRPSYWASLLRAIDIVQESLKKRRRKTRSLAASFIPETQILS